MLYSVFLKDVLFFKYVSLWTGTYCMKGIAIINIFTPGYTGRVCIHSVDCASIPFLPLCPERYECNNKHCLVFS